MKYLIRYLKLNFKKVGSVLKSYAFDMGAALWGLCSLGSFLGSMIFLFKGMLNAPASYPLDWSTHELALAATLFEVFLIIFVVPLTFFVLFKVVRVVWACVDDRVSSYRNWREAEKLREIEEQKTDRELDANAS